MKEKELYLKPNVVIEPLYCRWYAWPHLISPSTAAMNVTGRHLKIMNSYIQAPEIHAAAVRNPKMLGGPFMDLKGGRVDEVKQLRDDTVSSQQKLIELSEAIKELDRLLKSQAKGYSLQALYEKIPAPLQGYVELFYDLNNNPSYRFFEALLYNSQYYDTSFQSVALWLTQNDERPFVLSTPRLNSENVIHLSVPFSSKVIDELSQMKRRPMPLTYIRELVDIKPEQEGLFASFFTEEIPPQYACYSGDKIRMRYYGHACIFIETKDFNILVDPLISYYGYEHAVNRYSDMDLPDTIDYVLITHNHQDHILFETLLPLRHKIKNLVIPRTAGRSLQDPNLRLMFSNVGFKNIIEIDELETIKFKECTITGIPFIGEHSDLNIQSKICYHVKINSFAMLFVADSCNVEPKLYELVQKQIGRVDVVFLGMECDGAPLTWLYGPLLSEDLPKDKDGSRRLSGSDFSKGKRLVDAFTPKEVYVYAMGQEPWLEFISSIKYTDESNPIVQSNKLIDYCTSKGMICERLFGEKELLYSNDPVFSAQLENV